jgi:hypothetical protein
VTRSLAFAFLVVGLTAIGCASGPGNTTPPGYYFPTNTSSPNSGPTAALTGRVEVSGGCLTVTLDGTPGPAYLVGWPRSLRLALDGSGAPVIVQGTSAVAEVGSRVWLEGGFYESAKDEAFARSKFDAPVPCPGPIFLAWKLEPR